MHCGHCADHTVDDICLIRPGSATVARPCEVQRLDVLRVLLTAAGVGHADHGMFFILSEIY
jgi:hypothetical protein